MPKTTREMTDKEFVEHMITTRRYQSQSPVVTDPAKMGKPMDPKDLGIKPSGRGLGDSPGGSRGSVPRVVPGPGDEASRRVRECFTEEELIALCREFGLDPAIVTSAPNRGVGKMRVSNAIRKILRTRAAPSA